MKPGRTAACASGAFLVGSSIGVLLNGGLAPESLVAFIVLLIAGLLLAGLNLAEAGPAGVDGPGCAVMVVALLLGGPVGHYFGGIARDPRMTSAWEIETERPASLEGKGMWTVGDLVVRVRSDGALAYGMDGRVRWRYELPEAQVVCMMSPNAGGGVSVGLIGYAEEGEPCRRVAAVDASTGKVLWKHELGGSVRSSALIGVLAISSEVAVLPADGGVQAFDPRSGEPLWKARAKRGCAFEPAEDEFAVSAGRLTVVWRCEKQVLLESVNVATGESVWTAPVFARRRIEAVSVLSAEPAVVRVREKGEGGDDRILAFTGGPRPSGVIPVAGRDGRISFDLPSFPLVHGMSVQVRHGMIYVLLDKDSDDVMAAYGLDGRVRWSRTWNLGSVDAFSVQDEGIILIYDGSKGHADQVTVLEPSTGEDRTAHSFDGDSSLGSSPAWTSRHRDLTLVAAPGSDAPLKAYRKDKD